MSGTEGRVTENTTSKNLSIILRRKLIASGIILPIYLIISLIMAISIGIASIQNEPDFLLNMVLGVLGMSTIAIFSLPFYILSLIIFLLAFLVCSVIFEIIFEVIVHRKQIQNKPLKYIIYILLHQSILFISGINFDPISDHLFIPHICLLIYTLLDLYLKGRFQKSAETQVQM